MDRINLILNHPKYKYYLDKNNDWEKNRMFCKHDLSHFLSVARIGYMLILENHFNHSKDEIYAAALLHDIGRWQQYENQIPHEKASAKLSYDILKHCNFTQIEIGNIITAITGHRDENNVKNDLSEILYKSDKLSRACYNCAAQKQCNWHSEKKNMSITY